MYVRVYEFSSHIAYSVVSEFSVNESPGWYESPSPSACVFQFKKVYPSYVGEDGSVIEVPSSSVMSVMGDAPWGLKERVWDGRKVPFQM